MVRKFVLVCGLIFFGSAIYAQDDFSDVMDEPDFIEDVYSGTRVINGHSTETLEKGELEFRIEHRFGDMLPGWDASNLAQSWLGFESGSRYPIWI